MLPPKSWDFSMTTDNETSHKLLSDPPKTQQAALNALTYQKLSHNSPSIISLSRVMNKSITCDLLSCVRSANQVELHIYRTDLQDYLDHLQTSFSSSLSHHNCSHPRGEEARPCHSSSYRFCT